jgi:preprotein translocase subunit YajC
MSVDGLIAGPVSGARHIAARAPFGAVYRPLAGIDLKERHTMQRKLILLAGAAFALTSIPALAQDGATPPAATAGTTPTAPAGTMAPAGTTATTAAAPTAKPDVAVGKKVVDAQGGDVGTISAVQNGVAMVDTGTSKAGVAVGSFAAKEDKLVLGMTKAQLDQAAQGQQATAQADLQAALTPGAAISDSSGGSVGKVDAVEGEFVTVATASNVKAKLPKTAFAKGPNGLVIGMTAAQLEAAAKGGASTPSN